MTEKKKKNDNKCKQCGVEVDFYSATITPEGRLCKECTEKRDGPGLTVKEIVKETVSLNGAACTVTSFEVDEGPPMPPAPDEVQVDHPPHYTMGEVEVIDALEAWFPGTTGHRWNAIKYLARAGRKGPELVDLKKARWYVDRAIGILEGGEG